MYDFYRDYRRLNIKKVVIISAIFIVIIIGLIIFIAKKISTPQNNLSTNEVTETSTVFYSYDNSISIELSNNLNLKNYNSNLGYILELRSDDNLDIFVAKKDIIQNKTLAEVVNADKSAFIGNFKTQSNLSDVKELSINDNLAYTYSFHYLDETLNTAFYLQVIWLQINNNYYIFDIEFPLEDLSFYTNISTSILSSFKIYSESGH